MIKQALYSVRFCFSQSKLNLHTDVLSYFEIQKVISDVIATPEQRLIESIRSNEINPQYWHALRASKKLSMISIQDAIQILKALNNLPTTQEVMPASEQHIVETIYETFLGYFKSKLAHLTISEMATILHLYAFNNRFNQDFFREFENEIYERYEDGQMIQISDVEKILEAYQHCYYGSATLYSSIAKTIKIAHQEINPLKLVKYAYLFKKSPERDYGVATLAEKQLMERIRDYDFTQLIKISKYVYGANICSNNFQIHLEEKLSEKFGKAETVPIPKLIQLAKITSKYVFRYNDKALFHKIESSAIHVMEHLNHNHFCDLLWSFLRSKRGNAIFYEKAQVMLRQKLRFLSDRQLTLLTIHSITNLERAEMSSLLLEEIIKRFDKKEDIKPVYLVYLLIAMVKSQYKSDLAKEFENKLVQNILDGKVQQLSIQQKVNLLGSISKAILNPNLITISTHLLGQLKEQKLTYEQKIVYNSCCQLFYRYLEGIKEVQIEKHEILNKELFHYGLYLYPQNRQFLDLLQLLADQHEEELRFCFSQPTWVMISWSLLCEIVLYGEKVFDRRVLLSVCEGLVQLDINTLPTHVLQYYSQAVWMSSGVVPNEQLQECVVPLVEGKMHTLTKQAMLLSNPSLFAPGFAEDVSSHLRAVLARHQLKIDYYDNLFDPVCFSLVNSAAVIQEKDESIRLGVLFLKGVDFAPEEGGLSLHELQAEINEGRVVRRLRRELMAGKVILERQLEWNVIVVVEEVWAEWSEEEKRSYLERAFHVEVEVQQKETLREKLERLK